MNPETAKLITSKWTDLRQREKDRNTMIKILPASIRSLESIVRLSYSYAKLRLSKFVEIEDAIHSLEIYLESFYGGYENVSERFFEGYEEFLKKGKDAKISKIIKEESSAL